MRRLHVLCDSSAELNGRPPETELAIPTSAWRHRRLIAEMPRKLAAEAATRSDKVDHRQNALYILSLLLLNALMNQVTNAVPSQLILWKLLGHTEPVHNAIGLELDRTAVVPELADSLLLRKESLPAASVDMQAWPGVE